MYRGNFHQLDSSVIVEFFTPENKGNKDRKRKIKTYFESKVGTTVTGLLSIPALGEVVYAIRKRVKEKEQVGALENLNDLIKESKIEINSPKKKAYETAVHVLEQDYKLDPADALRVGEAVEADAVLVTIDKHLLENQRLQKETKIISPEW